MVESMIGLLRQDQSFIQATRCNEGFPSDSKIPVIQSLSIPTISVLTIFLLPAFLFPVLIIRDNSPCDTVFNRCLFLLSPFESLHYSHFSLAIIGCKGSQNLIRM
ncbi:iso-IS1 ORF2 [Yersinia frederiksenii]|nr:hypothetical protein CBW53_19745 [Yersinia frederiksenii]CNI26420.1 iso-IS1 ORF2 [Yersinia frederiksenii]CNJ02076.1 iso-IS1 ORF2 [Yersinia frederiksenii]CNL13072.1 iso-IS1 ORF2 [Yersinia frederiksenii]